VSPEADPDEALPPVAVAAVVVAAGSSSRMVGRDKLESVLAGRTVLRWSVEALAEAGVGRIVIVTSPGRVAELAAAAWLPDCVAAVVAGGKRRQESVAAGIAALQSARQAAAGAGAAAADRVAEGAGIAVDDADAVVLVHDAARPFASPRLIRAVARAAFEHGAAIPVLAVTETLKRLSGERVGETLDRSAVVAAQTPQGVRLSLLRRAYASHSPDAAATWTDEASLLEACRIPVHAIEGEPANLKVTVPADLRRAAALLAGGLVPGRPGTSRTTDGAGVSGPAELERAGRVGLGLDGHPFGPDGPLALGGVRIDGVPRLAGHSDGDAALHAVADALLGAAGLGDLGRLFPADARTPVGIDSRTLLRSVADRVRAAGWTIANVDLTIVASRPRLAPHLPQMERAIAAAIGTESAQVNVKASTGNLGGQEGSGRWISAQAIAWIVPSTIKSAEDSGEGGADR
jgi:2-C-methyl-D-erythritol 4-phosphate cytidylyltransferase/2-C-methyl-D-erythritol 2,4-cyclodiphosphate synthase